ncbi:MAG: hypothetical protein EPO63_08920 [Candidatus Nitrosotenuis sp.]|nr:MAG: hypothetical protein EPO63_08920 [Candidatus Nitrosotenuis sp.]
MGLLRFVFWVFLFFMVVRLIGRVFRASFHFEIITPQGLSGHRPPQGGSPGTGAAEMVRDPSCGAWIAADQAIRIDAGATTQFFCSRQCLDNYRRKLSG